MHTISQIKYIFAFEILSPNCSQKFRGRGISLLNSHLSSGFQDANVTLRRNDLYSLSEVTLHGSDIFLLLLSFFYVCDEVLTFSSSKSWFEDDQHLQSNCKNHVFLFQKLYCRIFYLRYMLIHFCMKIPITLPFYNYCRTSFYQIIFTSYLFYMIMQILFMEWRI